MKGTVAVGLAALFLIAACTSTLGATYFVATNGSDSNPGTESSPWATLQKGCDAMAPGDTTIVLPGTYIGCRAWVSGAAGAPKTLKAQKPGTVLVNAPGAKTNRHSNIEIQNPDGATPVEYWVIDGFEVANAPSWGIDARGANFLTVRNCVVHDSGKAKRCTGIYSSRGNNVLIENNTSYSNAEHGIYVCNSADNGTVRGNTIYSNPGLGVHMNGDVTMIPGDGIISGWVLEKNKSYDNGTAFDADGVETTTWRNNLAWGNHGKCIQITGVDGAITSRNNRILNNTLLLPADGYYCINITIPREGKPAPVGNKIFNNILYHYSTANDRGSICVAVAGQKDFESDYNVVMSRFAQDDNAKVFTLDQWRAKGWDVHSIQATDAALFVNPAGHDYRLAPKSPAIDAGTALSDVMDDIEGTSRPQGAACDIGCYEHR